MPNTKQTLLTALLTLHAAVQDGTQKPYGICNNVGLADLPVEEWEKTNEELKKIFARWPEFSGRPTFPVRGEYSQNFGTGGPRLQYLWGVGKYGQARRRLLDFCIAELQRELAPPAGIFEPVKVTSKTHKPTHGGYPGMVTMGVDHAAPGGDRSYTGTDANYEAIKATTPTTCCPCGQVPMCHGLRSCGKSDA